MISDHVNQENLVEQSFSYANAHSRGNKNLPNRTAQARQAHLSKIEANLAKSKQNVVKHVLESRSLEKSIVQAQLVDQALQLRLETSLGLHNGRYEKYLQMIKSGNYDFLLNEQAVYAIELACAMSPPNLGKVLYNILSTFTDSGFAEKLESMVINPTMVTPEFFFKVSNASSNGAIRYQESCKLYEKACEVTMTVINKASSQGSEIADGNNDADALKWKLLKRLLRRKLLLIKLTMTVFQSPEYYLSAGAAPTTAAGRLGVSTAGSSLSIDTMSLQNSRSEPRLLVSPGRLRHKDLLSTSLERSKAKQVDIKSKISNSIMSMYGADILPVEALRKNKAALETFRKIAAEKLFTGVEKLHVHFLRSVMVVWRKAAEAVRVEGMCHMFQQRLAAYRMLQVLELSCARSIYSAMQTLKEFVNRHRENEFKGAVQQLQRCWRGSLGRHKAKQVQRHGAATTVQGVMRVFLAKKATRELMRIRRLRMYVRVIENNWRSHVWQRTMKKIFQLQKTIRKAKLIQRAYRGFVGRRRFAQLDLIRTRGRNAIKFQSVWRRYRAIVFVEIMLLDRKGRGSAIKIQKVFRGFLKRVAFVALRLIHRKAKVIQYLCLRRKAYKEMMRRKRNRCATKIQRIVRGRQGRRRFALVKKNQLDAFEAYWRAVAVVAPIILGYATRKRWAPRVKAHIAKRRAAAMVLQKHFKAIILGQKARLRVIQIRAANSLLQRQNRMIVAIQRRQRGIAGREKSRRQRKKLEQQRENFNRLPYYYRMKEEYYRTQNMYHRSRVVKIQCAMRCHLARARVYRQRREVAARKIQRKARSRANVAEAKAKVELARRELANKIAKIAMASLKIVLFVRRRKVEIATHKRLQAKIIRWFLTEVKIVHKLKHAKLNFRLQSSRKFVENKAVTKIQAVIRGKQAKEYVARSRKRLERQRQARRVDRRQKASVKIQGRARIYLARKKANKKRQLREEEERERREFEDLELSLEGLHEDFMKELLVIRTQKGVRSMLAKNNFIKRVAEAKLQKEKQIANAKLEASKKIQAMIRGVLGRIKFKKNLPQLRRAQKVRSYCCECESTTAVRRCRQCKDKYCAACYDKIHAKGTRRSHGWEHIKIDPRAVASSQGSRGKPGFGGLGEESVNAAPAGKAARKHEWEEFYDQSARAKYWFNKVTGEASWTQPV